MRSHGGRVGLADGLDHAARKLGFREDRAGRGGGRGNQHGGFEIVEATGHPVLAELLEMEDTAGPLPVEVDDETGSDEQIKTAFRALIVAAFDDESFDVTATPARIKELLKSYEKLIGRLDDAGQSTTVEDEATPESLAALTTNVAGLLEEVRQLRRCETARQVLDAAGIESRDLEPARLRLLFSQADESAMKSLVESWPPYVRQPRRMPAIHSASGANGRYPATLDEFVSLVK